MQYLDTDHRKTSYVLHAVCSMHTLFPRERRTSKTAQLYDSQTREMLTQRKNKIIRKDTIHSPATWWAPSLDQSFQSIEARKVKRQRQRLRHRTCPSNLSDNPKIPSWLLITSIVMIPIAQPQQPLQVRTACLLVIISARTSKGIESNRDLTQSMRTTKAHSCEWAAWLEVSRTRYDNTWFNLLEWIFTNTEWLWGIIPKVSKQCQGRRRPLYFQSTDIVFVMCYPQPKESPWHFDGLL